MQVTSAELETMEELKTEVNRLAGLLEAAVSERSRSIRLDESWARISLAKIEMVDAWVAHCGSLNSLRQTMCSVHEATLTLSSALLEAGELMGIEDGDARKKMADFDVHGKTVQ